jgi:hypothetical protein
MACLFEMHAVSENQNFQQTPTHVTTKVPVSFKKNKPL